LTKSNSSEHFGNVIVDDGKIIDFSEKHGISGLISAGVYVFESQIFDFIEQDKNLSLEKDIFPHLARLGHLYGYLNRGYFMDIGRPETYNKFKDDALKSIFVNKDTSISSALSKMIRLGTGIILVVDSNNKLLGVITDRLVNSFILQGGRIEESVEKAMTKNPITARTADSPETIKKILLSGVSRLPILDEDGIVKGIEFRAESVKLENFPTLRGRAPLRISFAGGGTDIPYFFEKYGGVVISATINKYCYATITKRADMKVIISSDIDDEIMFDLNKEISYNGRFDLIKAIIKIMNPNFGFELCLHNDIPPGRGLGSSATLSVLLVSMLSQIQGLNYDDHKIAEIAFNAEREELKIKGGWQDQHAAITGGFNFMEFNYDKRIIYPLKLKEDFVRELKEHLTLCYVGNSHNSGDLHTEQENNFIKNEEDLANHLSEIKRIAISIKDALLTNELENIGHLLNESWQNKKRLNKILSNPKIDRLYETGLANGAYGGKLLGAGGGGYILFFHKPNEINKLRKILLKSGGDIMDFDFDFTGTSIWPVKR